MSESQILKTDRQLRNIAAHLIRSFGDEPLRQDVDELAGWGWVYLFEVHQWHLVKSRMNDCWRLWRFGVKRHDMRGQKLPVISFVPISKIAYRLVA